MGTITLSYTFFEVGGKGPPRGGPQGGGQLARGASIERAAEAQAVARRGSFLGTMKAVAWSFFGVRRSAGYEHDMSKLNPVHVVIAG